MVVVLPAGFAGCQAPRSWLGLVYSCDPDQLFLCAGIATSTGLRGAQSEEESGVHLNAGVLSEGTMAVCVLNCTPTYTESQEV